MTGITLKIFRFKVAAKTFFFDKLHNNAICFCFVLFCFVFFASKKAYPIVRQLAKISVKKEQAKVV